MLSSLRTASFLRLSLIAVAASLAACNDDDALRGGDDHDHTESSGRLAFATVEGDPQLLVHDLDSGQTTAIALSNAPTAVYASPEGRYAVVVQSGAGQVNFVDGGIWLHDDHAHADEPELLDFTLFGAKPAHYQTHEEQAALFYDGEGGTPAKFDIFSDESLAEGGVLASQTLPAAVHGVAEPRDGYVLAVDYSAEEAAAGAPRSAVKLYELHDDHFHDEGRFETLCENLHGSATNEDYVAFGCQDGVLLIEQDGSSFTDSKIAIDRRITQMAGHDAVPFLVAFAGADDDDALFVIDPAAGSAEAVDWKDGAAVNRRQHTFDAHGEHLLILDSAGTMHVLEVHDDHFDVAGRIDVLTGDDTAARMATSAAGDLAFVTDSAGKSVVVVDLEDLEVVDHIDLGFAPVGIAWLGIAEEEHGHDH